MDPERAQNRSWYKHQKVSRGVTGSCCATAPDTPPFGISGAYAPEIPEKSAVRQSVAQYDPVTPRDTCRCLNKERFWLVPEPPRLADL